MSTYIATFDENGLNAIESKLEKATSKYAETEEQMVVGGVFFNIFGILAPELAFPVTTASSLTTGASFYSDSMETLVYETTIKVLKYIY